MPCHSSTPKSASKSSVIVYQGISQPIRAFQRSMSACGRARDVGERGVARVEVGEVGDLVGHERAAAAAALGPAGDAGLEEEAVDDQLAAPLEQVEQARRPVRSLEAVLLLHRHPRHPAAFGGERVAGAGQLLLLDQQLLAGGVPLLRRDDRRHLHFGSSFRYSSTTSNRRSQRARWRSIQSAASLEHLGLEREPVRPALDHAGDDARLLQHLQVLGDRRLGDAEAAGDFADGRRAGGEAFDDPAADRVRERLEWIVNHLVNSTRRESRRGRGDAARVTSARRSGKEGAS